MIRSTSKRRRINSEAMYFLTGIKKEVITFSEAIYSYVQRLLRNGSSDINAVFLFKESKEISISITFFLSS